MDFKEHSDLADKFEAIANRVGGRGYVWAQNGDAYPTLSSEDLLLAAEIIKVQARAYAGVENTISLLEDILANQGKE